MSFSVGSAVAWVTVDRATGKPHRSTVTEIRAFEDVQTSAGPVVRCAVLSCNRLAPVSELFPVDAAPDVRKAEKNDRERAAEGDGRNLGSQSVQGREPEKDDSDFLRSGSKPAAGKADRPKAVEKEVRGRDSVGPSERSDVRQISQPCNVLAIDFMNLLVRAWHVGKPTETHAVRSMFQTVANAIRRLNPAYVVFALDGGHTRRTELLPSYKAHRPEHDPNLKAQIALGEQALKVAGFHAIRKDGWEADDVLASLAESYSDTVIVSSDKDLLVMTGRAMRCRVYHPWGEGEFATAKEKIGLEPEQITDYLALCGDTSDGVPGVSGIGPKTAAELLKQFDSLEGILVAATTGQIKGAKGEKLKTQREQAMLCREVIQLNWDLTFVPLESFSPVSLWRQKLQDMRLQSVTAIMESLQGLRFAKPAETILSKQHFEAAEGWPDADECLQWAKDAAATVAEMRAWRRAQNGSVDHSETNTPLEGLPVSASTAEEEPGGRTKLSDAGRGVVDATQVDRLSQDDGQSESAHTNGSTSANSTEDTSVLSEGPAAIGEPVSGSDARLEWLQTQFQQGQKYAQYARAGRETENPWRRDSAEFTAWEQGFRGEPFEPTRADPVRETSAAGKRGVLF